MDWTESGSVAAKESQAKHPLSASDSLHPTSASLSHESASMDRCLVKLPLLCLRDTSRSLTTTGVPADH